MFKLGLTGSIGMGKSTTAQMFAEADCDVWDADAAVHRLYAKGGAAVGPMTQAFPKAIVDGAVSRDALKTILQARPEALTEIERIVHPLVRMDREQFMKNSMADIMVFDIPLLFEKNSEDEFDAVACVIVDADTQKRRVLERGTMTPAQLDLILSKQLLPEEKAARADYVIATDTLENARQQVHNIIEQIKGGKFHA